MITRDELWRIAKARLKDAQVLFENNWFDGAVYVCAYAVEIGLKAKICDALGQTAFPETDAEFARHSAFKKFKIHKLVEMKTADLIRKLTEVGHELERKRGTLELLTVFQRRDSLGLWDVVVSADWIGDDILKELETVVAALSTQFSDEEMIEFSGIILLAPNEEVIQTILKEYQPVSRNGGILLKEDFMLNGMSMRRGYVVSANNYVSPVEQAFRSLK